MKTATTLPAAVCEWSRSLANYFDVTPNHSAGFHQVLSQPTLPIVIVEDKMLVFIGSCMFHGLCLVVDHSSMELHENCSLPMMYFLCGKPVLHRYIWPYA